MKLYHFTSNTGFHLEPILAQGVLRPTESNIGSPYPGHKPHGLDCGPRVVWLTETPDMSRGDNGLSGSVVDKTRIRFTVEVADAVKWTDFSKKHGIDKRWYAILDKIGGGTAKFWWVVPRPILAHEWTEVRDMETGKLIRP